MQLVIIEPHHHFDVLLALEPSILNLSVPILIVCSPRCKEEVVKASPGFDKQVRWNTEPLPKCPKTPSLLFFTSLQYQRGHWLDWIKAWPSAVMIHNANLYAQVLPSISSSESKYSRLRFGVEKHFRNVFRNRLTKKIIRYIDTFIPFSPVQNDFMLNHLDKPIHPFSVAWRQSVLTSRDYDFIPIYGRMQNVDWNYFEKVRSRFAEQLVCLCEPDEYEACKQVFPGRTQYIFTPLPHLDYIKWYKEAKRIIIPFKKKVSFGLSREVLGSTKYLWRIYWALQFDKSLLMSDDIIRPEIPESPSLQIPQFEEIIRFLEDRMEEKP